MWTEDLCESSEVDGSWCALMSSCFDEGSVVIFSSLADDPVVVLVFVGGAAAAAISFFLFLKLNFFGGSKLFLTVCSFSDSPFMVCMSRQLSVVEQAFIFLFSSALHFSWMEF